MKKIVITTLAVFLVLGCVQQAAPVGFGAGLKIDSFSFVPSSLLSGGLAAIELNIQNLGSKPIEDAYVYLYGLGEEWEVKTTIADGDVTEVKGSAVLSISEMYEPSEELGDPGEKKRIVWEVKAPRNVPEKQKFPYTAQARVCYPYETIAIGKVTVLENQEWISRQSAGEFTQAPIAVSQTSAPITISLDSKQPIAEREEEGGSEILLELRLRNVGGGTVFSSPGVCSSLSDLKQTELNRLSGFSITLDGESCAIPEDMDIYFTKGRDHEMRVTCRLDEKLTIPERELDLVVSAEYNYYVDSPKASITVEGLP